MIVHKCSFIVSVNAPSLHAAMPRHVRKHNADGGIEQHMQRPMTKLSSLRGSSCSGLQVAERNIMMRLLATMFTVFFKVRLQMQFAGAAVVTAGVCTAAWPSEAGKGLVNQARLVILPFYGSYMSKSIA